MQRKILENMFVLWKWWLLVLYRFVICEDEDPCRKLGIIANMKTCATASETKMHFKWRRSNIQWINIIMEGGGIDRYWCNNNDFFVPLIVNKGVDTRSLLLALLQSWNQMNLRAQIYDNDLRIFHFSLFPDFKIH